MHDNVDVQYRKRNFGLIRSSCVFLFVELPCNSYTENKFNKPEDTNNSIAPWTETNYNDRLIFQNLRTEAPMHWEEKYASWHACSLNNFPPKYRGFLVAILYCEYIKYTEQILYSRAWSIYNNMKVENIRLKRESWKWTFHTMCVYY